MRSHLEEVENFRGGKLREAALSQKDRPVHRNLLILSRPGQISHVMNVRVNSHTEKNSRKLEDLRLNVWTQMWTRCLNLVFDSFSDCTCCQIWKTARIKFFAKYVVERQIRNKDCLFFSSLKDCCCCFCRDGV